MVDAASPFNVTSHVTKSPAFISLLYTDVATHDVDPSYNIVLLPGVLSCDILNSRRTPFRIGTGVMLNNFMVTTSAKLSEESPFLTRCMPCDNSKDTGSDDPVRVTAPLLLGDLAGISKGKSGNFSYTLIVVVENEFFNLSGSREQINFIDEGVHDVADVGAIAFAAILVRFDRTRRA